MLSEMNRNTVRHQLDCVSAFIGIRTRFKNQKIGEIGNCEPLKKAGGNVSDVTSIIRRGEA